MNKKLIGIYGYSTGENSFGVGKQYLDFAAQYGVPRILTPDNLFDESIDVLLLVGGMDVSPKSFNEIPGYFTSNTDVFKQHVYDSCLPNYVGKIPIIGICLGMQQLGVFFGSKLTQNLPAHEQSYPDNKPAHDVICDNLNLLKHLQIANKIQNKFKVTSTHHQGFLRKDLSNDLDIICYAQNEEYTALKEPLSVDIVECFIHKTLPIIGIQSHPERYCPQLFDYLIKKLIKID